MATVVGDGPPAALLIHGAWQGAWVWDALAARLRAAGTLVMAPDLPGNGIDATPPEAVSLRLYVDFLSSLLENLPVKTALIAHSGGGVIASQLAEAHADRVSGIAYLAGMMLPSGTGFRTLTDELLPSHPEAAGIGPHLIWSADRLTSTVPPDAARTIFFHDLPPEDAQRAARRLTPQPEGGRAVTATLTAERFGRLPRLYIEALHDRSIVLPAQRRMQALVPGARVVSMPTGHAPHIAAPDLVAAHLLSWLVSCRMRSTTGDPT